MLLAVRIAFFVPVAPVLKSLALGSVAALLASREALLAAAVMIPHSAKPAISVAVYSAFTVPARAVRCS